MRGETQRTYETIRRVVTTTTTGTPAFLGTCQARKFSDAAQTACNCDSDCHVCDMWSNGTALECQLCKNSMKLLEGVCVSSCPAGDLTMGTGSSFGQECVDPATLPVCTARKLGGNGSACDCGPADCHSCRLYNGVGVGCLSCSNSKYLFDGACLTTCPVGYDDKGTGSFGRTCVVAPTTSEPLYEGVCRARMFSDAAQTPCSCNADCFACVMTSDLAAGACLECKNSQKLLDDVCVSACPAGNLTMGSGSFGQECVDPATLPVCNARILSTDGSACSCGISNCRTCHMYKGAGVDCQSCSGSKYLWDNACVGTCPAGTTPKGTGSFGRTCTPGAVTTTAGPPGLTCAARAVVQSPGTPCECESQCFKCALTMSGVTVIGGCTMCKNSQYLEAGVCVASCSDKFVEDGTGSFGRKCVPAPTHCIGYTETETGDHCSCKNNCHKCLIDYQGKMVGGTCTICKNGMYLTSGGACVSLADCPTGTSSSLATNLFGKKCD